MNATVVKTSAGAAEHVRIARVTNLVRALEELKRQNVWCVGLDERGSADYDRFDYRCNFVLVLGGEGSGLHELTRRTCDHLLRIPMAGQVSSLNVSVAGAIVMYEAARQRRAALHRRQIEDAASAAVSREAPSQGIGFMNFMRYGLGFFLLLFAVGSSLGQSSGANNQNNSSSANGQVLFSRGDNSQLLVKLRLRTSAVPAALEFAKSACCACKSDACDRCRTHLVDLQFLRF